MNGRFLRFAIGYWGGKTRRAAWLFSLGFLACLAANLYLALAVNRWSKGFFDALQFRDVAEIYSRVNELVLLVLGTALVAVATIQCRMRLQVGWRMWLMSCLLDRWLRAGVWNEGSASPSIDNPEARIADDGRISVELFVDLAGGVINIFIASVSFAIVLWNVGGSYDIVGVTVPGYLVFTVVIYTGATSFGMLSLGQPLVSSVEEKAAAEGNFRFALMQARERLEESSDGRLAEAPLPDFRGRMRRLTAKWMRVVVVQTRIAFLSSANNIVAPAVPLLLCAPKYISGAMTLGDLIQAAAAFVQVQTSLNWIADNIVSIANWSASAHRVAALEMDIEKREGATRGPGADAR